MRQNKTTFYPGHIQPEKTGPWVNKPGLSVIWHPNPSFIGRVLVVKILAANILAAYIDGSQAIPVSKVV